MQHHQRFLQVVLPRQVEPVVERLYGIIIRQHQRRVKARQKARRQEQTDITQHQFGIEQIGESERFVGQLIEGGQ